PQYSFGAISGGHGTAPKSTLNHTGRSRLPVRVLCFLWPGTARGFELPVFGPLHSRRAGGRTSVSGAECHLAQEITQYCGFVKSNFASLFDDLIGAGKD